MEYYYTVLRFEKHNFVEHCTLTKVHKTLESPVSCCHYRVIFVFVSYSSG